MIEAGVVVTHEGAVFWHLPPDRSGGALPDSRKLWDVLWDLRATEFLGFAHSHPHFGTPGPSHTDITTFSAVERGLGRRLEWWIASMDRVIVLRWTGPGKHDYTATPVEEEPDWVAQLREHTKGN
jgi:hypothetical protein